MLIMGTSTCWQKLELIEKCRENSIFSIGCPGRLEGFVGEHVVSRHLLNNYGKLHSFISGMVRLHGMRSKAETT